MASPEEIERRKDTLKDYKAEGYHYGLLVELAVHQWEISDRQAKRYLKDIKEEELEKINADSSQLLAESLSQIDRLFVKAIQQGDLNLGQKILGRKLQVIRMIPLTLKGGKSADETNHSDEIPADELERLWDAFEADGQIEGFQDSQ